MVMVVQSCLENYSNFRVLRILVHFEGNSHPGSVCLLLVVLVYTSAEVLDSRYSTSVRFLLLTATGHSATYSEAKASFPGIKYAGY